MGERGAANLALYAASKHAVEVSRNPPLSKPPLWRACQCSRAWSDRDAMLDRLTGTPDKKAAFYAAIPLKRGAKPEEIADAVVFLASDKRPSSPARSSGSTAAKTACDRSRQPDAAGISSSDLRSPTMITTTTRDTQERRFIATYTRSNTSDMQCISSEE